MNAYFKTNIIGGRMIYFIGGASRSGKTTIAKRLAKQLKIPYLSTDTLMMGFTNGLPELKINDKMWPDEIAVKMWPFIRAMAENMIYNHQDYIIEGEALLPSEVKCFTEMHLRNVKSCFIGFDNVDIHQKILEVKNHANHDNDWLVSLSDEEISSHIKNMIGFSHKIKLECSDVGLNYFSPSKNFERFIDDVVLVLSEKSEIGIRHLGLFTVQLEETKSFYMKYFDAVASEKYTNPLKGFSSYFLTFPSGDKIEIMHKNDMRKSHHEAGQLGYHHIAIGVGSREKVDDLTNRLIIDGYQLVDGPRLTGDGYYESVVRDCEGNHIELTV